MRDDVFIRVLNQYKDDVFRYCVSITRNFHDSEDLVQDVFVKLYQTPIEDDMHARHWLFKVCHNDGVNMVKSKWRKVIFDPEILESIPDQAQKEEVSVLLNCPIEYRPILYLYYYEGYSQKEIAEIVELSVDAVKKRMQRGKEYLRENLRGGFSDE